MEDMSLNTFNIEEDGMKAMMLKLKHCNDDVEVEVTIEV